MRTLPAFAEKTHLDSDAGSGYIHARSFGTRQFYHFSTEGICMKQILFCMLAIVAATAVSAQENPLAKSSRGDWARYLVTSTNETEPLMSSKDQQRWWNVSNVGEGFVRIDSYLMFGGNRVGGGGNVYYFKDHFEPVAGIGKSAKVQVVSTSTEKLSIKGKQYGCTKIVRKIDQPLDEANIVMGWAGTSTIWICSDIPLGLAKVENRYLSTMSKSDKAQKIVETWVVDDFGFKNWK
jgi:hypothetical protein